MRKALEKGLIGTRHSHRTDDHAERERLIRRIHKLAGSAASFGEAELGEAAIALEQALTSEAAPEQCETLARALLDQARAPFDNRTAAYS